MTLRVVGQGTGLLHQGQVILLDVCVRVDDVLASLHQLSQELDFQALVPALAFQAHGS